MLSCGYQYVYLVYSSVDGNARTCLLLWLYTRAHLGADFEVELCFHSSWIYRGSSNITKSCYGMLLNLSGNCFPNARTILHPSSKGSSFSTSQQTLPTSWPPFPSLLYPCWCMWRLLHCGSDWPCSYVRYLFVVALANSIVCSSFCLFANGGFSCWIERVLYIL